MEGLPIKTLINYYPSVAVLLAAYNGQSWIDEQVNTILSQEGVDIKLFISVDLSQDSTQEWCEELHRKHPNVFVLPYGQAFGGASRNFYRLFRDVDFFGFDFVALADQDDIWLPDKLKNAIGKILEHKSSAYSSNVLSFWGHGGHKIINKMQPQRKYDHLFQGGGAGCTYVFTSSAIQKFKVFLVNNWDLVNDVNYHDWLIYAYFRTKELQWYFDTEYTMLYRQHASNEFGSNAGIKAAIKRIVLIKSGWYKNECQKISNIVNLISQDLPYNYFRSRFYRRFFLIRHLAQLRRSFIERIILLILIIFDLC